MYNEQCQGGSMCMNNSCNCPSGGTVQGNRCSINGKLCEMNQVEIDNRCYNTSQIGQTCQLAQQCLGGSTCLNNICICPSGTQQQGDRCIGNDNTCSSNQVTINGQCYAKVLCYMWFFFFKILDDVISISKEHWKYPIKMKEKLYQNC